MVVRRALFVPYSAGYRRSLSSLIRVLASLLQLPTFERFSSSHASLYWFLISSVLNDVQIADHSFPRTCLVQHLLTSLLRSRIWNLEASLSVPVT